MGIPSASGGGRGQYGSAEGEGEGEGEGAGLGPAFAGMGRGTGVTSLVSTHGAVAWFAGVCGACTLGIVAYTCATDGGPFRRELLIPWMVATLVDFYANVALLALWVVYRERAAPVVAGLWVAALVCLGSMATAAYVAQAVLTLPAGDPVYSFLLAPQDLAWVAGAGPGRRTPLLRHASPAARGL